MSNSDSILHLGEIEFYVTQTTVSKLEDLGTLGYVVLINIETISSSGKFDICRFVLMCGIPNV